MSTSGFSLPGEWHKQSGVLLTWPHENSDWVDDLNAIEALYIQLAITISLYEKALIVAYDETHKIHINALLKQHHSFNAANIIFFVAQTDDTWTRDYGPICLCNMDETKILNFTFNGWGNKFDAHIDNQLTECLVQHSVLQAIETTDCDFILEGGSIDSDGNGTVLTTSSNLLTSTRNPSYTQQDIEKYLQSTLGVRQILWLDHGYLAGDDTDSHIDVLARFTDSQTIVYIHCEDSSDEHYSSSRAMEAQLRTFRNCDGKSYQLIPLPFPAPIFDETNRRLAASYANFLIINDAVLVPTYDDDNDERALKILQSCFNNRKVIGIPCLSAIQQNGSLHCLTMQLPAGVLKS